MAEHRDKYMDDLVNRAMNDEPSPADSMQYAATEREDNRPRSRIAATEAGSGRHGTVDQEDAQSRTRSKTTTSAGGRSAGQAAGQNTAGKKRKNTFFKGLISGTVISDSLILKDIRYSALIMLLAIAFIANRFNAERMERDISALEQEVSDLRAEALSVSADLGSVSRQSEITDLVKERGLGLEELREPPYRIVVNE
jgi:hypothetical protein